MYQCQMEHNDFLAVSGNIKAKNLHVTQEGVLLKTNRKGIKTIKTLGYEINILDKPWYFIMKNDIWFVLGAMIFIFISIVNNYRVSDIQFNDQYPINKDIAYQIEKRIKYIGPFAFFNADLQSLNEEIRAKYPNYDWITINKNGSRMLVKITKTDTLQMHYLGDDIGDIYAKKSGVVTYYQVFNGQPLIKNNQYVRAGDLLVSATNNNPNVSAKGVVLASVFEETVINLPKKSIQFLYTGYYDKYQELELFGRSWFFNRNTDFDYSEKKLAEQFNLGFLRLINVEEKEKSDIITIYSQKEAIQYGEDYLINKFNLSRVDVLEHVEGITLKSVKETDLEYQMVFLVHTIESIGEFKRR